MNDFPDNRSYQLVHFDGAFEGDDCDRLRRVLRRAEEVGGWWAPAQHAGAAWVVVGDSEADLIAASRFGTDLVFTGHSAARLATAVERWIDGQASLPSNRRQRSFREDPEAAQDEESGKDSAPSVR